MNLRSSVISAQAGLWRQDAETNDGEAVGLKGARQEPRVIQEYKNGSRLSQKKKRRYAPDDEQRVKDDRPAPGMDKTPVSFGAAVVKSQAMEGRSGDRDRRTIVLAELFSEAAIRDDRFHKLWGPGVRSTEWIT